MGIINKFTSDWKTKSFAMKSYQEKTSKVGYFFAVIILVVVVGTGFLTYLSFTDNNKASHNNSDHKSAVGIHFHSIFLFI